MSRGIGAGPGVYYDGYSFQGEGVTKDSGTSTRRSGPSSERVRGSQEGPRVRDPPPLPGKKRNGEEAVKDAAMPMDPVARGLKPASKGAKGGDAK